MELKSEFMNQLRNLDRSAKDDEARLARDKDQILRLAGSLSALQLRMGFRERHLGGWFGGNKDVVGEYRRTEAEWQRMRLQSLRLALNAATTVGLMRNLAADYAAGAEPAFARLVTAHVKLACAVDAAEQALVASGGTAGPALKTAGPGFNMFSDLDQAVWKQRAEIDGVQGAPSGIRAALAACRTALDVCRGLADADGRLKGALTLLDGRPGMAWDLAADHGGDHLGAGMAVALLDAGASLKTLHPHIENAIGRLRARFAEVDAKRYEVLEWIVAAALSH